MNGKVVYKSGDWHGWDGEWQKRTFGGKLLLLGEIPYVIVVFLIPAALMEWSQAHRHRGEKYRGGQ